MADSNNINRGNDHTVAAEDPFAELARLLSGDNEQESHESRAQPEPVNDEPADEAPVADDPFAVDLEKELLGDMADVEAAHAAATVEEPDEMDAQFRDNAPEIPDTDEPGAFEAAEEPDIWADDMQTGAEDVAYREEVPAYDPPFEGLPSDGRAPEGYHARESTDPMLADVDMDFGELDADGAEPVDAEPLEDVVAEIPDAETPEAVSLEEELQMLLADTSGEVSHAAAASGAPAGAVAEAASRLGRANYVNAQGAAAPVEAGGWDESGQTADDQEDADVAVESFDDADVAEFPVADDAAAEPDNTDTDPFADLAAIMARSGGGETSPQAEQAAAPVDIETVEVPETALEQADDLQLPDLPADEPAPQHPDDEFEADLGYDFNIQSAALDDTAVPEAAASEETPDNQDDEDRFYAEALGLGTAAGTAAAFETAAYSREPHEQSVDVALDEAMSIGDDYDQPARETRDGRSGFLIAGAVVAVALIGGIGAFALSFGGDDGPETPVLVEADSDPLKVKPESPGGAAVPEQDSAAHEAASGVANTEPTQENLVSTTEEPVNIASRTVGSDRLPGVDEPASDAAAAAAKSEDRLEPAATEAETALANDVIAVQPRRVRTMIVRPDGTLVAREEPAAPAAEVPAQPAPAVETTQPVRQIETTQPAASGPAVAQTPDTAPAATTPAQPETVIAAETPATETAATEEAVAESAANDPVTPSVGPVATPRPASQQAAEPQQVAQAAPAARTEPVAPAPAPVVVEENSTWSMQIASQPTAESAQATYQDLARRYGELLGGRGVNIVRAEIPGKGTYYRVRIPTTSRADGIALCERYKAIGGSCFVSK